MISPSCCPPLRNTAPGVNGHAVAAHNMQVIRAWFIAHPCASNLDASRALGLSNDCIGRYARRIRAEWAGKT